MNGGVLAGVGLLTKEEKIKIATQKWLAKEKRKLQGLADIRIRAAEAALKAAMRLDRAEMEIKEAQRAAMGLD